MWAVNEALRLLYSTEPKTRELARRARAVLVFPRIIKAGLIIGAQSGDGALRIEDHYFNIMESDGRWQSYPVDYTIGSKWQQAYATKLPNGQIHVFPIQYSIIEKKWLNYWKVIDTAASERANPYSWERLDAFTSDQFTCAVCHTSQLRNTIGGGLGPDNVVFREPGIGCEMCHGPSAAHVDMMTTGTAYTKGPLDPPVDFNRITTPVCLHLRPMPHAIECAQRQPARRTELLEHRHFFPEERRRAFGRVYPRCVLQRWKVKPDNFYGGGFGAFTMFSQRASLLWHLPRSARTRRIVQPDFAEV